MTPIKPVTFCGQNATAPKEGDTDGRCMGQSPLEWQKTCHAHVLMHNLRTFVSLVSLVLLAIGCAGSSSTPASPSAPSSVSGSGGSRLVTASDISGVWNLVSIQPAGQAVQNTPSNSTYTLTFADGRMSTRADCNLCGGAFALSGQTLSAGPALACTRAACPTMAFENTYTGMLSGDSAVTLSGTTLELSSVRGVLRFTR